MVGASWRRMGTGRCRFGATCSGASTGRPTIGPYGGALPPSSISFRRCSTSKRRRSFGAGDAADAIDSVHELGNGAHPELLHHARAVQLHGALAHTEVHRDDLVGLAAHDTLHDFFLARRQQRDAPADVVLLGTPLPPFV